MNNALPITPVMPLPAASLPSAPMLLAEDSPPWRIDDAVVVSRSTTTMRRQSEGRIVAEPIPWAIVVLTAITAMLVAFGTGIGSEPQSRVMTFAAGPSAD